MGNPPMLKEARAKEREDVDEAIDLAMRGAYGEACAKLISAQHWDGYCTGAVWEHWAPNRGDDEDDG